jgi:hypothetical protein
MWGGFGFRRNGLRGWSIERRKEIVGIERGFDSFCERAFGCERFAEDSAVGRLDLNWRRDQLGATAK